MHRGRTLAVREGRLLKLVRHDSTIQGVPFRDDGDSGSGGRDMAVLELIDHGLHEHVVGADDVFQFEPRVCGTFAAADMGGRRICHRCPCQFGSGRIDPRGSHLDDKHRDDGKRPVD